MLDRRGLGPCGKAFPSCKVTRGKKRLRDLQAVMQSPLGGQASRGLQHARIPLLTPTNTIMAHANLRVQALETVPLGKYVCTLEEAHLA